MNAQAGGNGDENQHDMCLRFWQAERRRRQRPVHFSAGGLGDEDRPDAVGRFFCFHGDGL